MIDKIKVNPVEEDVEVGLSNRTVDIKVKLVMQTEAEGATFNYSTDIDDVGQIVFTPQDTTTSFISITKTEDLIGPIINDNEKTFTIDLTADILYEDDSSNEAMWDMALDEVGQAVIYPIDREASFLSVSVKDSLNLITEDQDVNASEEDKDQDKDQDKDHDKAQENKEDATDTKETSVETEEEPYKRAEIKAKVIEGVEPSFSYKKIEESLSQITDNFTKETGTLKTTYPSEAILTKHIMEKYYQDVTSSIDENWTIINYENKKALTEDLHPSTDEYSDKKELALELIDEIEEHLHACIDKLDAIERLFEEIGLHYADIPGYFTNYLTDFIEDDRNMSCYELRNRFEEYEAEKAEESEEE